MQPDSDEEASHNICGRKHNEEGASCGPQGPESLEACPGWFQDLWARQWEWFEKELPLSDADWKVVVTHFPPIIPKWGSDDWAGLANAHGINLFISSHIHQQEVRAPNVPGNPLGDAGVIISGGGGGVTSEDPPSPNGNDDQYGFIDITFSASEISIDAITHGGQVRGTTKILPKRRRLGIQSPMVI